MLSDVGEHEGLRDVVIVDGPGSSRVFQPLVDGGDVVDAKSVVRVAGRGTGVDEHAVRPRRARQRGVPSVADSELAGQRDQRGNIRRREALHDAVRVGHGVGAPGVVRHEAVAGSGGREIAAGRAVQLLADVAEGVAGIGGPAFAHRARSLTCTGCDEVGSAVALGIVSRPVSPSIRGCSRFR
jgi:hypothetical protein